jgi:hypothetical protein
LPPPLSRTVLTMLSLSQFSVPHQNVKTFALTAPDPKGPLSPTTVALQGTEGGEHGMDRQKPPWITVKRPAHVWPSYSQWK